jgi:hypothetical protein
MATESASSVLTLEAPSYQPVRARAANEGAKTPSNHKAVLAGVPPGRSQRTTGIQQAHVATNVRRKNVPTEAAVFGSAGSSVNSLLDGSICHFGLV